MAKKKKLQSAKAVKPNKSLRLASNHNEIVLRA
jgi:hypothetical protein